MLLLLMVHLSSCFTIHRIRQLMVLTVVLPSVTLPVMLLPCVRLTDGSRAARQPACGTGHARGWQPPWGGHTCMGSTVKMRGSGKLNGAAFVTSSVTTSGVGQFPAGSAFFCMLAHCMGISPAVFRQLRAWGKQPLCAGYTCTGGNIRNSCGSNTPYTMY